MRFDRRLLTHFEWFLPLVAICVSALGILTVYSASYVPGSDAPAPMAMRQLVWCVAGLGAMLAMLSFDYRRLERHAYLIYLAALLGLLAITMLVLGGVQIRWLALLASPVVLVAPLLWRHLKEYQQKRILTFLDPGQDPLGAGYHVIQSKIAVGSGMIWGKGFLQGTQNHLSFLPEQHTDFIFSVFSEEWGLVGGAVLVGLYLALVMRGTVIAARARNRFGALLVLGVLSIVFWQVVVNVGMTTGLLPVVGIPLPFFSYGGSSLLCLLMGIGLAMNVSMRRFLF